MQPNVAYFRLIICKLKSSASTDGCQWYSCLQQHRKENVSLNFDISTFLWNVWYWYCL